MISLFQNGEEQLFLVENYVHGEDLFQFLQQEIEWKQNTIKVYGKNHAEPRLTAWFGPPYKYSSIQWPAQEFSPKLEELRKQLSLELKIELNAVLLNYYRSGNDGMGWHSDNEKEMDQRVIASLSLGGSRKMSFKSKVNGEKLEIVLPPNSLLIMKNFQKNWQHSIPKSKKEKPPRINLTFRRIITD